MQNQKLMKTEDGKRKDCSVTREQDYVAPAVDIFESDEAMTLVADMPGLDEQSLQVNIEQGLLTLEGRIHVAIGSPLRQEFALAGYRRQFQLPDTLEADAVRAELKNGVLLLHLPKVKAAQPRKIEVTVH